MIYLNNAINYISTTVKITSNMGLLNYNCEHYFIMYIIHIQYHRLYKFILIVIPNWFDNQYFLYCHFQFLLNHLNKLFILCQFQCIEFANNIDHNFLLTILIIFYVLYFQCQYIFLRVDRMSNVNMTYFLCFFQFLLFLFNLIYVFLFICNCLHLV